MAETSQIPRGRFAQFAQSSLRAIGYAAFLSVCLGPFLFGAVERSIWIPLCVFWLALGLAATTLRIAASPSEEAAVCSALSRALLALHGLFVVQLIPMPGSALRWLSAGAWNAHFFPDPGDGRFRPLSISPSATVEAWLYVSALQGLFIALQGIPEPRRKQGIGGLVAVALLLGAEGLWQSRSAHPNWFYGRIQYFAYPGLESGGFGPYFNRNHFATVTAMGSALAAGLAASLSIPGEGAVRILRDATRASRFISLLGVVGFLGLATAASGSRSGLLALTVGLGYVASKRLSRTQVATTLALLLAAVVLSGSFVMERLLAGDMAASRIPGWIDIARLTRFFPLFGSGIGTFVVAYLPYQFHNTYEIWQHAHNEYLEWLIEGGILGLVVAAIGAYVVKRTVFMEPGLRPAAVAALMVFGVQAFADFPARIPANTAFLTAVLALVLRRR